MNEQKDVPVDTNRVLSDLIDLMRREGKMEWCQNRVYIKGKNLLFFIESIPNFSQSLPLIIEGEPTSDVGIYGKPSDNTDDSLKILNENLRKIIAMPFPRAALVVCLKTPPTEQWNVIDLGFPPKPEGWRPPVSEKPSHRDIRKLLGAPKGASKEQIRAEFQKKISRLRTDTNKKFTEAIEWTEQDEHEYKHTHGIPHDHS